MSISRARFEVHWMGALAFGLGFLKAALRARIGMLGPLCNWSLVPVCSTQTLRVVSWFCNLYLTLVAWRALDSLTFK